MSNYPLYGNIFVDSSNNGGLGGTLSITNSCNTATLGNQASIAFDVANVSYSTLGQGLIQSGVDIAGARISAVIDRVAPAVGTALVMNVSGNALLPPTEAMRISSNGNVGIGVQIPQYALDVSNTGIRSTQVLSNGIKTTSVVAISNPTNVAGADFVIGQGTSSTATTVHAQNNIFIGNPPTALTTSGRFNVGVGNQSLTSLTVGGNNVALGYLAGNALTTGTFNTAIGANAFSTGSTFNFSTAVGYNAQPTGSNQVVIGTNMETVVIPGGVNVTGNITTNTGYYLSYSTVPTFGPTQIGYNIPITFLATYPTGANTAATNSFTIPIGVWMIYIQLQVSSTFTNNLLLINPNPSSGSIQFPFVNGGTILCVGSCIARVTTETAFVFRNYLSNSFTSPSGYGGAIRIA